MFGALTAVVG
jgi:hypothetical protein